MIANIGLIYTRPKLILMLAVVVILAACEQAAEPDKVEVVRPVKLVEVSRSTGVKNYSFPAVIEAAISRDLVFQVSGQILQLNVSSGDRIEKGAVIAKLDQRSFRNELKTARAQYDSAKTEFDRAKRLIAENAIAKNVYQQRQSQLDVASAQLDSVQKALEDTVLYSPFDGVVATRLAKELDTVSPSQPVITLQTTGAAEAVVNIPANLVAKSKQIQPIDTLVVLDSAPEFAMPAEMIEASGLADEASQTFVVKFGFTPPESLTILPGMTGVVRSRISFASDTEPQITVPLNAVLTDGAGAFAWVASGDPMTVTRRDLKMGDSVGEFLTVESGLSEGDLIVGAGASYLHEGMKIRRLEN